MKAPATLDEFYRTSGLGERGSFERGHGVALQLRPRQFRTLAVSPWPLGGHRCSPLAHLPLLLEIAGQRDGARVPNRPPGRRAEVGAGFDPAQLR